MHRLNRRRVWRGVCAISSHSVRSARCVPFRLRWLSSRARSVPLSIKFTTYPPRSIWPATRFCIKDPSGHPTAPANTLARIQVPVQRIAPSSTIHCTAPTTNPNRPPIHALAVITVIGFVVSITKPNGTRVLSTLPINHNNTFHKLRTMC